MPGAEMPENLLERVMAARKSVGVKLIGNCFRAPALTERYAGEGELVFGLTKHVAILAERGREVNTAVLLVSARSWACAVGGQG